MINKQDLVDCKEVELVDKSNDKNNLELYCYNNCSNSSSSIIKKARGVVFQDEKVVFRGYDYTEEYSASQEKDIKEQFSSPGDYKIFNSEEGTLLRIFNVNGIWYVSTNKKFNAFQSRWSGRFSFGDILVNTLFNLYTYRNGFLSKLKEEQTKDGILTNFLNTLNPKKGYMILLRSNRYTRIVCNESKENEIFHVGTLVDGKISFKDDIGLPKQTPLTFKTVEDMVSYVKKIDPFQYQGVIMFKDYTQYKIYNDDYQGYKKVRGNQPSVFFRYLQVRGNLTLTNALYKLYPYESHWFQIYEKILYNIAVRISKCYIRRYIRKQYTSLPKLEYLIMKECYEWYLENPQTNQISIYKILSILNSKPASYLHSLIKLVQLKRQQRQRRPTPTHRSLLKPLNNRPMVAPL